MATKPSKPAAVAPKAVAKAAPKAAKAAEATEAAAPKQGRAITLPNGEKRADYIRNRFAEGVARGDIMREINKMLEEAGRGEEKIPYQIVFAATKPKAPKAAKATAEADEGDEDEGDEDEDEE